MLKDFERVIELRRRGQKEAMLQRLDSKWRIVNGWRLGLLHQVVFFEYEPHCQCTHDSGSILETTKDWFLDFVRSSSLKIRSFVQVLEFGTITFLRKLIQGFFMFFPWKFYSSKTRFQNFTKAFLGDSRCFYIASYLRYVQGYEMNPTETLQISNSIECCHVITCHYHLAPRPYMFKGWKSLKSPPKRSLHLPWKLNPIHGSVLHTKRLKPFLVPCFLGHTVEGESSWCDLYTYLYIYTYWYCWWKISQTTTWDV